MLQISGLSKCFKGFALRDISFSLAAGDYFVLLGESGAGKTLILEMLAGLVTPDAGAVCFSGRDITQMAIQERRFGLVYQDHALFPHLTVQRNIAYPMKRRNGPGRIKIQSLAERVGAVHLLQRKPETLSLGEAQRVALARALAMDPPLLLLDEPLASLDTQSRVQLRALLRRLNAQGQTILHVTHDFTEALALANRVGVLEDGCLSQLGTPDEVFFHPRSRFVASFVGIRNFLEGAYQPSNDAGGQFHCNGLAFEIGPHAPNGPGCLILDSRNISVTLAAPAENGQNTLQGTITDMERVRLGVELNIDIGTPLYAQVNETAVEALGLTVGSTVWASFKAGDCQFVPK